MTLKELINNYSQPAKTGVPDWLLGCFRRYSISFANGTSDLKTQVFWLQSRNFTIDIRMPMQSKQVSVKPLDDYTNEELQLLANYEGFSATTDWNGELLSWRDADAALQIHNRWTQPAILKRVGNCMVEFCPSDAYVEDWRAQPTPAGPLVGLRLLEELETSTGAIRHQGGGLIVSGDYAGLVLGRAKEVVKPLADITLNSLVAALSGDKKQLSQLFNFETSVAKGNLEVGFKVDISTQTNRLGQTIFSLDGFEAPCKYQHKTLGEIEIVRQKLIINGQACERLFTIDTIEPQIEFSQSTPVTKETAEWYVRESAILMRYSEVLT
jgi:hypothetical protein